MQKKKIGIEIIKHKRQTPCSFCISNNVETPKPQNPYVMKILYLSLESLLLFNYNP